MTPGADPPARFDARLRTAIVSVACVAGALGLASGAVFGPRMALSVAAGGVIATANLWALARIVLALLPSDSAGARAQSRRGRGGWAVVALAKMLGLVGLVWLLMRHGVVAPLPMLVGFGSLPIGIAIGSLLSDRGSPAARTQRAGD